MVRATAEMEMEMVTSVDDLSDIQQRLLGADLLSLLQIDVDALQIYNAVLQKIETRALRTQIEEFAEDHENHIADIEEILDTLGIPSPGNEPSPLARFMIQEIQQVSDEGDALLHFLVGEHVSAGKYGDCLKNSGFLPEEVVSVVTQGTLDEHRHFNWAWEELQRFDLDVDLGPYSDLHAEHEAMLGGVENV